MMEGSGSQAIADGKERWQKEGKCLRWRGVVSGGEKRSLVEGSGLRWRGVIAGGGERF